MTCTCNVSSAIYLFTSLCPDRKTPIHWATNGVLFSTLIYAIFPSLCTLSQYPKQALSFPSQKLVLAVKCHIF